MRTESRSKLTLTNAGELELYFVGAGSAFAKSLNQNNLMIIKGDEHVLVDCGTKCSQALHEKGVSVASIRNFLITHSHADHIGGLEEVQLFNRYVIGQKPNMIITEEYEDILWDQSLRGGSERSESELLGFRDLWQPLRPSLCPDLPRETWEFSFEGVNLKMPRTMHFPDSSKSWEESAWSCAVIIDDRVLFTSDTRFDPELIMGFDELFDFECIFHDCQLFNGGVHASLEELGQLPDSLRSKTLLMHYGDNWRDFEQQAIDMGFCAWVKQEHSYIF